MYLFPERYSAIRWVSDVCEQVRGSWPPFITVGKPFTLQLRASNATQHVLDLSLRLGDTTGFMLAGGLGSLPSLALWCLTARWQGICYCMHTQHGAIGIPSQGIVHAFR